MTHMGKSEEVRRLRIPAAPSVNSPFHRLMDEGGDWDRRNCLKVYTDLHFFSIRQFQRGGELLLDALSTSTTTELLSYNEFVGLTGIAHTLNLKRLDLRKEMLAFLSTFVSSAVGRGSSDFSCAHYGVFLGNIAFNCGESFPSRL